MINLENIMKKSRITFLVMFLILLPLVSYADADLSFLKSNYMTSSDTSWDYGINVITPGNYSIDVYATNLATQESDASFELFCDSNIIGSAATIPWNSENTECKISFSTSLSSGKHKLTISSVDGTWSFSKIEISLSSLASLSGSTVPGDLEISENVGAYGSTVSTDSVYMDAGSFFEYELAVNKSGTYKFEAKGKFDGTDGNRLIIRLNNAELTIIEQNDVTTDYIDISTNIDLPAGTHNFEIYNDDGHYSLKSFKFSLVSEKDIAPIEKLTKVEYEKDEDEVVIEVTDESGLSVEEAKKRISDGLQGIIGTFGKMFLSALQPIVDLFADTLKGILTKQSGIIEKLVFMYIELITTWARLWMFELLLYLLRIIDALMSIFDIFAGTKYILVNDVPTIFLNMFFENSLIRNIFWGIFILGIALNLIFSIISVTRSMFTDDSEKSLGPILRQIGKSFATYVVIPIFVIFSVNLASVVLLKLDDILTINTNGADLTFGNTLFMVLSFGEETDDYAHCSVSPTFTDDARATFYHNNTKYERSANTSEYFYFSYFKILGGLVLSGYIIVLLALAIILFVTRVFDLILLFLVSPYFAASISLDGGERFADWRKLFIAKLVSGFGLVIMMKLFVGIVLPIVTDGTVIFSTNAFINAGFMILILTAGCYAIFKSHNLLMKLIDPQAALAEMGIAEVAVGAAHEVANIVKSEMSGGAARNAPSSSGLSNEQKDILSK